MTCENGWYAHNDGTCKRKCQSTPALKHAVLMRILAELTLIAQHVCVHFVIVRLQCADETATFLLIALLMELIT